MAALTAALKPHGIGRVIHPRAGSGSINVRIPKFVTWYSAYLRIT